MTAQLSHTIVWCRDKHRSAAFVTEILQLPSPEPFRPMLVVKLDNGVSLDFYERDGDLVMQHYAEQHR